MAKESTTPDAGNGSAPERPGSSADRLAAVIGDIVDVDAGKTPPDRGERNRTRHQERKAREAEREIADSAKSRAEQRRLAMKAAERDDGDDEDEDDEDDDSFLLDERDEEEEGDEDDERLSDDEDEDDEDADDDAEADEEEDGDRAGKQTPSKQAAQPTPDSLHEVTLPGGEKAKVTYQELQRGYSREQDYTVKTQQLAGVRDQYKGLIDQLVGFLDSAGAEEEPDWAKIAEEDPIGVANMRLEFQARQQKRKEQLAAAKDEQERLRAEDEEKLLANWSQHIAAEKAKLPELIPQWSDEKIAKAEIAIIKRRLAEDYGFTEEEIKRLSDARAIALIRKAVLYDQIKRSGKNKMKPMRVRPNRTLRPGARSTRVTGDRRNRKIERARDRLRRTGSDKAAEEFFGEALGD